MDDRAQRSASQAARRDDNNTHRVLSEEKENQRQQQGSSAPKGVARYKEPTSSLSLPSRNEPRDGLFSIPTTIRHTSQRTYASTRLTKDPALVDITYKAVPNTTTTAANALKLDGRATTSKHPSTISRVDTATVASQAVSYVRGSTYTDRIQAYHGKSSGCVPPSVPLLTNPSPRSTTSFTVPIGQVVYPHLVSTDKAPNHSSTLEAEQSSGEVNSNEVSMVEFKTLERPTTSAPSGRLRPTTAIMASPKQEVSATVRRGGQRQRIEPTNHSATGEETMADIEYPRRHAPDDILASRIAYRKPPVNKYLPVTSRPQFNSNIPVPIRHTKRAYSVIERLPSAAAATLNPRSSLAAAADFPTAFSSGRNRSPPKQTTNDGEAAPHPAKRQKVNEAQATVVVGIANITTKLDEQRAATITEADTGISKIHPSDIDPAYVAEYSDDIFDHLRELEILLAPDFSYLWDHSDEYWMERQNWVEIMSQICVLVDACNETLFLAVNILDRALSRNFAVSQSPRLVLSFKSFSDFVSTSLSEKDKNYIIAITCVLIAAKYEERNRNSTAYIYVNYISQLGISVDAETFRRGEREMLAFLDYRLGWPGPLSFLRRFSRADGAELWARTVAKYILEVALFDQRLLIHKPSTQAAAALNIGRRMMGRSTWTYRLVRESGYTVTDLDPAINDMFRFLKDPIVTKTTPFGKYMRPLFFNTRLRRSSTPTSHMQQSSAFHS
ncbi:hypothetical protein EMPS_03693 [Entomortierella parvispora]|uniref:Cyclin N-terminal domain-containing protein n=1 Tax=Entomortierella parvispora TaxID=205924 RepID=A0A9P3H796_9FUNG|nr:hypothetical protein EMPS_03693 [Entomortierella parvispora]